MSRRFCRAIRNSLQPAVLKKSDSGFSIGLQMDFVSLGVFNIYCVASNSNGGSGGPFKRHVRGPVTGGRIIAGETRLPVRTTYFRCVRPILKRVVDDRVFDEAR